MKSRYPQAILLDFYNTVVQDDLFLEICPQIAQASALDVTAAEVGAYWGRLFLQQCARSFGPDFRTQKEIERLSVPRLLYHFQADLDGEAICQRLFDYWARPKIYAESREVLALCRRPICLVSNSDEAELQAALAHNKLQFDWIVTSEDCRAYKPRPEMFQRALSLLDLPADKVLHVGDSLRSDIRGAKACGIPVLWINRKNRPAPDGDNAPDYIAADLTGLLKFLS